MLTEREKQVHKLLAQGHPTKIIAFKMGLAESTVKVYLKGIFDKLGVNNRIEAALKYQSEELMENQSTKALQAIEKLPRASFQMRVYAWLITCFGEGITFNRSERNHRFLEESLELVQSLGCTREDAHMLVDYVYGRPMGDPKQEVGGTMLTLAALCVANAFNMEDLAEIELARAWGKIEQIRAKQASKQKDSALPGSYPKDTCDHAGYDFLDHGRYCPQCSTLMVDAGD